MRAHFISAVGAVLLALSAPAFADDPANELSVGGSTRALRSASADAITGDSLDGGAASFARDLGITLLPRLSLWADAGVAWGSASGTMFQTMSTDLSTFELRAGGRARYRLHHLLALTARVDVGTARAALTLAPSSGAQLSDARWGGLIATSIAGDFLVVDNERMTLGLRLELGYVKASAIELHATPTGNGDDTIKLSTMSSSFGHLDLSGPTLGLSFVGSL